MAISRYAVCSCNAYRQMFPGDSHGPLGLGMTYKIVKSPIFCHCEERSDVAISRYDACFAVRIDRYYQEIPTARWASE